MNLFSKEKGIVLSLLNAVLVIWLLGAVIFTISNLTSLIIKEPVYTYEEYKIMNCDFEFDTVEDCENNYEMYKLDSKYFDIQTKRSFIVSVANIVLVFTTLILLNKNKRIKN